MYKHTSAQAARLSLKPIDPDTPEVQAAVEAYKATWKLPAEAQPQATVWLGVFDDEELLLVSGERYSPDAVEITDMYPVPGKGRKGVIAIYALLKMYADVLATGRVRFLTAVCLYQNRAFQRAVQKVFGLIPTAVVYSAESAAAAA